MPTQAQRIGYQECGRKCQKFDLFDTAVCIQGGRHFLQACIITEIYPKGQKHRYRRVYECQFLDGTSSNLRSIDLIWPIEARRYAQGLLGILRDI